MTQQTTGDDDRRTAVGEALKDAFAALASPDVPAEDRPRWHQRLIAITNSAKHDLPTAEARLQRYRADWDARHGPPA